MAGVEAVLSLAGRTQNPARPPIPVRIGGFGGANGLADYLRAEEFGVVVDATHPFATRISANAAAACARLGLPRATFTRPPWVPDPHDLWTCVADLDAAAAALGATPRRVLLTTGRLGLAAFKAAPQHDYLVRTIDPPHAADCPAHCRIVFARGPFPVGAEVALLVAERIEILVSKNSGGPGAGKIQAARHLGLPVVMVQRPAAPTGLVLTDIDAVTRWITDHGAAP